MTSQTVRAHKRLHCRESDGDRTGILILSEEHIELYFVGYDEFVHVSKDKPTYVVTEEGKVVSLHANVAGRHSSHGVATKFAGKGCGPEVNEYREVNHSGIISNQAVIGADAWRPEDLVRQITFDVALTESVLRHREKLESLGRSLFPAKNDLTLFRANAKNMSMTAGYAVTYGIDTRSIATYHPTFSIEIPGGCQIGKIEEHIFRYLSFLSFILGGRMSPNAVRIDRLSYEEMLRAVEAGTYVSNHEVFWNWKSDEYEVKYLAFHGAPFIAQNDHELESLAAGLTEWVERYNAWEYAYIRMTDSFSLRHTISGERLLAAWRWFEELPNAKAEKALDVGALEPVIRAALDEARNQALGGMEGRIRGTLRQIGVESIRDRFARLLGSIQTRYGANDISEKMLEHLMDARTFRGRVAHGHFTARDDDEMRRFNKATLAMEAFCFLLTAHDLPITEEGKQRIWSYPMLEDYRLAYG